MSNNLQPNEKYHLNILKSALDFFEKETAALGDSFFQTERVTVLSDAKQALVELTPLVPATAEEPAPKKSAA